MPKMGNLAERLGKPRQTAERLMKLAEELEPYPNLYEAVDEKKIPQVTALKIIQEHPDILWEF